MSKGNDEGVKFVVARISECLWDYQSDSYKRPALNSGALLWECRHLIGELYSDNITLKTIDPVFEELKYSLRNGEIVSRIESDGFQACRGMICEIKEKFSGLKKDKRHEVHQRLEKMFAAYFKESLTCVERSLEDFCENPNKKESIARLIGNWLTELVHRGVSHQGLLYIFRQYLRENKELGIVDFLSLIKDTHKKITDTDKQIDHTVVLKVNYDKWSYLRVLLETLGDEKVEVLSDLPKLRKEKRDFFEKKHNHTWLKVNVKAIDPHTALIIANQRLNRYFSYISFENHQSKLNINPKVFVYTEEYKAGKLYPLPSQSVHKRGDGSAGDLGILVNNLISLKKEGKRLSSLIAALNSHHVAMVTKDVHTQLLSIWSALEAVGEDPVTDGSRFEYVANYIVPILAMDYAEQIFANLLERLDKKHEKASGIINDAFISSELENKLACFINILSNQDNEIHKRILKVLGMKALSQPLGIGVQQKNVANQAKF